MCSLFVCHWSASACSLGFVGTAVGIHAVWFVENIALSKGVRPYHCWHGGIHVAADFIFIVVACVYLVGHRALSCATM